MSDEKPVGMFSATAAKRHGTVFWETPEGTEVELTAVTTPSNYKFPDAVVVGPVTRWKRGRFVDRAWRP